MNRSDPKTNAPDACVTSIDHRCQRSLKVPFFLKMICNFPRRMTPSSLSLGSAGLGQKSDGIMSALKDDEKMIERNKKRCEAYPMKKAET